MASTTTIVKVLLLVLSIIGVFGTWILVQRNGALSLLEQIASRKLLPGTNQPLQKSFTGIKAVDDQLKILVIFFWQVVDGSTPTSSLQSLHFEGQVIAGWVLCMLEGLRDGNRWRIISLYVHGIIPILDLPNTYALSALPSGV